MAEQSTIDKLREELLKVPELTKEQRDLLTSEEIVTRALPIMTAFATGQVKAHQDVLGEPTKKIAQLAERLLVGSSDVVDTSQVWKNIIDGNYDASWTMKAFDGLADNIITGPIVSWLFGVVHIITSLLNILDVSQEKTKQSINKRIQPYLLDLGTLTRLAYRDPNNINNIYNEMSKMGLSQDKAKVYMENAKTFLPIEVLSRLWFRGEMSDDQMTQSLRDLIFDDADINKLKTALYEYPPIQDWVRFAVREVMSPELAEQLGLFADMPPDFVEAVGKAGLKPEHARMYWGAHWEPIPTNQAFEMLHRGIIDQDELMQLLRINDVTPRYREQLLGISYNPITRVDLRRLYEKGYIDEDRLYSGYLDLGYNEENATIITEWVIGEYGEDRRDLAKSDILSLYEKGYYTRQVAFDALRSLKYNEAACEELLIRIEIKIAERDKKVNVERTKRLYLARELSRNAALTKLLSFYLSPKEADDTLVDWDLELQKTVRKLTIAQLKSIYDNQIWSDGEITDYLIYLGYPAYETEAILATWAVNWETKQQRDKKLLSVNDLRKIYILNVEKKEYVIEYLNYLGYPENEQTILIALWDAEKRAGAKG